MKTINQKTNLARGVKNIKSKNFLLKSLILLAVIASSGFGFKAHAQYFRYEWVNNSDCDITLDFYDAFGNRVVAAQTTATNNSSASMSGCFGSPSWQFGYIGYTDVNGCFITVWGLTASVSSVISTCYGQTGSYCSSSNRADNYSQTYNPTGYCGATNEISIVIDP